jgi:ubiquinone/menaquinone biosynthesis C-methylase UbiE
MIFEQVKKPPVLAFAIVMQEGVFDKTVFVDEGLFCHNRVPTEPLENSFIIGVFGLPNKKERLIIFSTIYKKYWEIGFKTWLYGGLSPEAYLESIQRTADSIKVEEGEWILDAGCGSGLLLSFLPDELKRTGRYLGMDILPAGLDSLKSRANRSNLVGFVSGVQADLSRGLPLGDASISCVAAHFSVYTLPEGKDRRQAYQELWRVLKPGGLLVTTNPTHSYDAKQIIDASLESLKQQGRPRWIKKFLLYPLALHLGLKHIERQLKSGQWHGYQPEELLEEVAQAGFSIEYSETVYGGSGFLVIGRKS